MIARSRCGIIFMLGAGALLGCGSSTGPDPAGEVEITLAVTGGFAGQDWQYTIDGATGRVIGDRCIGPVGCDWQAGQQLAEFDASELSELVAEFFARDFFHGPEDYGTECCDQLDYVLSYRDTDDRRSVRGSDARIPSNIRSLILILERFVEIRRQ